MPSTPTTATTLDHRVSIDRRTGSVELAPTFDTLRIPYVVEELAFGDFAFQGYGSRGLGLIGIERKRIRDLMASMCDGRLVGHQLPGMFDLYDHSYLVVEGVVRPAPDTGILQELMEEPGRRPWWRDVALGRRRFMWRDLDGFLSTVEHSRVKVRRVDNAWMTAHTVASLHHWYTSKSWGEHKSLKALHTAPYSVMTMEDKSSVVRRIAKEFAGIGVDKSLAVCMKFKTVWDMVTAPRSDWETIPGIGPGISRKVENEIHGRQPIPNAEPTTESDTEHRPE